MPSFLPWLLCQGTLCLEKVQLCQPDECSFFLIPTYCQTQANPILIFKLLFFQKNTTKNPSFYSAFTCVEAPTLYYSLQVSSWRATTNRRQENYSCLKRILFLFSRKYFTPFVSLWWASFRHTYQPDRLHIPLLVAAIYKWTHNYNLRSPAPREQNIWLSMFIHGSTCPKP